MNNNGIKKYRGVILTAKRIFSVLFTVALALQVIVVSTAAAAFYADDVPLAASEKNSDSTPDSAPDPVPEDPVPADPVPEDPAPEDPVPADPNPEDPVPEDPVPEDPVPGDPIPEDPSPSDPVPEDPSPEDPSPEDPTNPTDPINPTDPTDPTDPINPTDPTPEDPAPEDPSPEDPASEPTPEPAPTPAPESTPAPELAPTPEDDGSSGGDGSGGSPEPSWNVEAKGISQVFIKGGNAVRFEFTKDATCVVYVGFDAVEDAGKTIATVEQLKEKSVLVSELPEGDVYKSFNVWVGNAGYSTSNKIENPVLSFRVDREWIQEKNADPDSIMLNRYEKRVWVQLPANLTGEDDKYLYFTADVPGYASFAVTGNSLQQITEESDQIPADNRSVGGIQLKNPEERGSEKDRNTILSVVIVVIAMAIAGVLLQSMKK